MTVLWSLAEQYRESIKLREEAQKAKQGTQG